MTNQKNIRNFCIIAHIDHGKSTLADRFLEYTGAVAKQKLRAQFLDQMDLERERGITIKMQPVRMMYHAQIPNSKHQITNNAKAPNSKPGEYILNMIDTPGHVDFQYEVSRSIAACEGAVLVVDAVQGIQAQTIANLYLALEHDLKVIPVINKIDLPNARIAEVTNEITKLLGIAASDIVKISAKTGAGVYELLDQIVARIPPPAGEQTAPFQALIFDSIYDTYQGVVVYVRVRNGTVKMGDRVRFLASKCEAEVLEVGTFAPGRVKTNALAAGEVGYIVTGIKEIKECRVGDTVTMSADVGALSGYRVIPPMVFASFFPEEAEDFLPLREGLERLQLNDASLQFEPASSPALGRGFRCGFLGLLHMEIVHERLHREFDLNIVVTVPSVAYEVTTAQGVLTITNPAELPDPSSIRQIAEPWVRIEIITPASVLGAMMELCQSARGLWQGTDYLDSERALLRYELPLATILTDFYDQLKGRSSGYASMSYEFIGFRVGDLARLDILLNEERVDAFSRMVTREEAEREGRRMVEKLKEIIPKHTFAVPIQAAIGGKIVARQTISALRKDVTAKLYGGDVTRKRKLLEKQKKGKKRMQASGRVVIPQKAFLDVLKREE